MEKPGVIQQALMHTIPVMMGYVVLGMAFGLVMHQSGIHWVWSVTMSVFLFAGSLQFVLAGLLAQGASLATIALATLAVNSRHLFYGLSFIDTFKRMGWRRPYMIFSLTDETYALLCAFPKQDLDQHAMDGMLAIAGLDQSYWVLGTLLGSVLGGLLPFDLTGVDFAMTALFTVIVVDQWRQRANRKSAVIGMACAVSSLCVFGPEDFLLPALVASSVVLAALGGRPAKEAL